MKTILDIPFVYNVTQTIFGGEHSRIEQAKYLAHNEGDNILDVGCGTAELLNPYLLDSNYYGYDIVPEYIEKNRSKYKEYPNIKFFCDNVGADDIFENLEETEFDIIMMIGVMHHLTDEQCMCCLKNIGKLLERKGRFVSIDPIRRESQPFLERTLVNLDRGKYIRYADEYIEMVTKYIPNTRYEIRHDLHRFPYTHIIFY